MLSPESTLLVRAHGALGARDLAGVEVALEALVPLLPGGGIDAGHVEESLLQSLLFVGFPQALGALAIWRKVSGLRAPEFDPDTLQMGEAGWHERGEGVCRGVYGPHVEGLQRNIAALHPAAARWMIDDGYGKVLGRPGASLALRECWIVALLAVQDVPVQLHSHLRGALRQGVGPAVLDEVLDLVDPWIAGANARDRVAATWARVRAGMFETEGPDWAGPSIKFDSEV